jgi:hypothetical protein
VGSTKCSTQIHKHGRSCVDFRPRDCEYVIPSAEFRCLPTRTAHAQLSIPYRVARGRRQSDMDSSQTPLPKSEFDGYYAQLQSAALKATKHAAGLPTDLAFHRSVDSDLAKELESCSKRVVSMTNVLLDLASTIGNSKSAKGNGKARLQDEDDFLDRFEALIVEPMDQLLERAVRNTSQLSFLLSPCAGYRSGPILWQDESACYCHQTPRTKKEGNFVKAPGAGHTTCISSPKTAN